MFRYAYASVAMSSLYGFTKLSKFQFYNYTETEGKGGIDRTRINQMFELIEDEITLYHFYNSNNPLHDEMNKKITQVVKDAAQKT